MQIIPYYTAIFGQTHLEGTTGNPASRNQILTDIDSILKHVPLKQKQLVDWLMTVGVCYVVY